MEVNTVSADRDPLIKCENWQIKFKMEIKPEHLGQRTRNNMNSHIQCGRNVVDAHTPLGSLFSSIRSRY